MPALKPATTGQKLLTDCGQNRPLTTRVSTRQEINAIYKRARNWNCLHSFWAGACDHDRYAELNEIFKGLRKEALKKAEV